jgi:hypothetical protein
MDSLSVTASITGIITAAIHVSAILEQTKDAPVVLAILTEVDDIKRDFCALQDFLDEASASGVTGGHAALIQLEDFVVILTQTVLVFSELEVMINLNPAVLLNSTRRTWRTLLLEPDFRSLVSQLQSHRKSLTMLLQIIQW